MDRKNYLVVGIFSIFLFSVGIPQIVFSDGDDSPEECKNGPTDESGGPTTIDAGSGNIISGICIKDGTGAFAGGLKHSDLIELDGTYGENDCYTVSGIGTQVVHVTENCDSMAISHVDYFVDGIIGGSGVPIEQSSLLISGMKSTGSYMIPILMASAGFGILIARRFQ